MIAALDNHDGMYIGVEVSQKGLTFRHDPMILVQDMSGDPMEKNTVGNGLLAAQSLTQFVLLTYNMCPAEFDACDEACETLMLGALTATASGDLAAAGLASGACMLDTNCNALFITCLGPKITPGSPAYNVAWAMASPTTMYMEEFPVIETIKLVNFRKFLYPMLFLTVLFINVQATLTQIGQEKERGIKNALALKGMRKEAFWLTWFLSEGMVLTTSCIVVSIAAAVVGVIEHTPIWHFFLTLWAYGFSLILLAFVLSSFFTKAKTMFLAAAV